MSVREPLDPALLPLLTDGELTAMYESLSRDADRSAVERELASRVQAADDGAYTAWWRLWKLRP